MSTEFILEYLRTVSNKNLWHNAAVHVVVLAALGVVFFAKSRETRRIAGDGAVFLLLASVVAVAVGNKNPFHLATMAPLAILSAIELFRGKSDYAPGRNSATTIAGLLSAALGFYYPEFVALSPPASLVFSPAGVIPCPTLLVVFGFLAMTSPGTGRARYWTTAAIGAFYGATGVFALGVYLDAGLVAIVVFSYYRLITASVSARAGRTVVAN